MIIFDDTYSFEKTDHGWQLHTVVPGKDKSGNDKPKTKTTYHSTLEQVAKAIVDKECGKCESIKELQALLSTGVKSTMVELSAKEVRSRA